jgi:hypothetical protein
MNKFLFAILVSSLFISSCSREQTANNNDVEYLIFGRTNIDYDIYTGYKLTTDLLYADSNTRNLDTLLFESAPLNGSKQLIAAQLLDEIPVEMFTTDQTNYSCPLCCDSRLVLIEIKNNGAVKRFYIDIQNNDIPVYLQNFLGKVWQTIDDLQ